jgi:hypothetical protein
MRIAFDLDDTLIPGALPFATEPWPRSLLARWFCTEPIRLGTVQLFRDIRHAGHEIWLYTTSQRSPLQTLLSFYCHGAPVRKVINADIHRRRMARLGEAYKCCTKFPPAFDIDVLIDDSEGVLLESKRYGFSMILVRPEDDDWMKTVKAGLRLC